MLPGYVAGHYGFDECHIDLVRLARFAGARLIHDEAVGLDRAARQVLCRAHPPIRYDIVSLDIGSTPRTRRCARRRRAHRPGQADRPFRRALGGAARRAPRRWRRLRLAVVGGGAGGVELALVGAAPARRAARQRARSDAGHARGAAAVAQSAGPRACFERILAERGIAVLDRQRRSLRVEPGAADRRRRRRIEFDEALWVTEAGGAPWLADTGLPLDARGLYRWSTRRCARPADPTVFAAGDVATMPAHPREKAGVYAVRAGPAARRQSAPRARRPAAAARRAAAARAGADRHRRRARRSPRAGRSRRMAAACGGSRTGSTGAGCGATPNCRRWQPEAGGRGRDALRRLRRQGAGRGAGARHGAARSRRRAVRSRSASTARTTRRWSRSRARRRCCRPSISSARWSTTRTCSGASPPPMRSATSMRWAALPETALAIATLPPARPPIVEHDLFHMLRGGTRGARAGRRGAGRRPQRRGRRTWPRLRGDRAAPARAGCCARAGCGRATG